MHKHGYAQTRVVVHGGSKDEEPTIAGGPDAGRSAASAHQAPPTGYRMSRYNTRPSSNWPF